MDEYLKNIAQKFARTDAANGREMIYRADFEVLLKSIFDVDGVVKQINHDATNDNGNKPDFVIAKNSTPILYIEAKDIGVDLDKIEKSEQMDRYFGYDNLVLTDYLEFRFYRNGEKYAEPVIIAEHSKGNRTISPKVENFSLLQKTLVDFASSHKEPIKNGKHLARIMGGKAQRIRDNISEMLVSDNEKYSDLKKIEAVVKKNLIADLDHKTFSDMYAQTLVYGLFAARYNDTTKETFSRAEARDLISKTNPFLRSFFDHIAGESFPDRLRYIVDELCEVFTYAEVDKLLHNFYGKEKDKDPVIHFYEDFLHEYDSQKKMEMGVFYTPQPIVKFIVGSVDSILKSEFNLSEGIADTTKIHIDEQQENAKGKLVKVNKEYHKVQILDVATGTGTFLNEVINFIHQGFTGQEGRWTSYVKDDLLPRLHGFELMIASYTVAHLKLGMTLHDTGVTNNDKRIGVYLTNTLEEPKNYQSQQDLFGFIDSIAQESRDASRIKTAYPIMCAIGNPPYAISSNNKGEWIQNLLEDYKIDLNEKKINIDDDYIKFIRFAQDLIDRNGYGIVAYISNNSFIDGVTHRQMRKSLLKSFSSIYVLDLHGNARKKEVSPDGGRDQNVFDIMQGVSVNIFVKNKNNINNLADIYHADLYGDRKLKFDFLENNTFENVNWTKLEYTEPYFFFAPKDFSSANTYNEGFKLTELFTKYSAGIKTKVDNISIDFDKEVLAQRVGDIIETKYSLSEIIKKFDLNPKTTWEYNKVLAIDHYDNDKVINYAYRPFDNRYIYFDKNFLSRSRSEIMDNFYKRENLGLETSRNGDYVFITNLISDEHFISDNSFKFPLWTYLNDEKVSNLNEMIEMRINQIVGECTPENILDYVYAYLYSSKYREKYREFLKIDFPSVPFPKSSDEFFALVILGEKLRKMHLMSSLGAGKYITTFSEVGSDVVEKITYKQNRVYINDTQYFGGVTELSWNYYIGGYQPAQKWLKDRKGRKLSNLEIGHYQKIIIVLSETDNLIEDIDKIVEIN